MIVVSACASSVVFVIVLAVWLDLRFMLDFALSMAILFCDRVCILVVTVSVKTTCDMGVHLDVRLVLSHSLFEK